MPPMDELSKWNDRYPNSEVQIEPRKRYFFICEGKNTEKRYFTAIMENRKALNICSTIDIRYLDKTGEDESLSDPKQLIELANKTKKNKKINFDPKRDNMIVVFDADIFELQRSDFMYIVKEAEKTNTILGVTNPSFELFLLLHYENSIHDDIFPNKAEILANNKTGRRRYISELFTKKSDMNAKKNPKIDELALKLPIAIKQEKKLNQDIHATKGQLTSNIGDILAKIIKNM